jgi:hypothetical protein
MSDIPPDPAPPEINDPPAPEPGPYPVDDPPMPEPGPDYDPGKPDDLPRM